MQRPIEQTRPMHTRKNQERENARPAHVWLTFPIASNQAPSFHSMFMRVREGYVRKHRSIANHGPSFHPMFMRVRRGSRFHSPDFAHAHRITFIPAAERSPTRMKE
jgi:hypothetical protein